MIDWERGLMKRKGKMNRLWRWLNWLFSRKVHTYDILYKLSHYYSSMRLSIHDHSYLYVVIVEGHVEIPTGLYVHPTLLNLFQVLSWMCCKIWIFLFVGHGPPLYWWNAICVKGLYPSSWFVNDVSPGAIYLLYSCCIYLHSNESNVIHFNELKIRVYFRMLSLKWN